MYSYPKNIIRPIDQNNPNKGYNYSQSVAHLLSLVSGVDVEDITACTVYRRSWLRYIPWYRGQRGGGAITLGSRSWSSITFTENFFSDDKVYYKHAAYLDNFMTWMGMSAHEVGHIAHTKRFGSFWLYIFFFTLQYIRHGHDAAPLEIEADKGRVEFHRFVRYMQDKHGYNVLKDIINSEDNEESKINQINTLWDQYVSHKSIKE